MVEIETEEQNDAIYEEALNQDFAGAWLGLGDTATEGEFLLGSGETPSFTNWAKGQPRNYKDKNHPEGEDCTRFNIKESHKGKPWAAPKKWNDVFCDGLNSVICQYEKEGFVRAALCERK